MPGMAFDHPHQAQPCCSAVSRSLPGSAGQKQGAFSITVRA
ncbi:MAG: hypothetical protein WDM85_13725 [Caulobacteraceae bacterium]